MSYCACSICDADRELVKRGPVSVSEFDRMQAQLDDLSRRMLVAEVLVRRLQGEK